MTGVYRPTGPTVKGTKRDGSPRVFAGKQPKIEPIALPDYLLTITGPAHMSVRTATSMEMVAYDVLGPQRLRDLEVHMDYFDAANEDAFGRLPHEAGYGSPLHLVPPAAPAVITTPHRKAA